MRRNVKYLSKKLAAILAAVMVVSSIPEAALVSNAENIAMVEESVAEAESPTEELGAETAEEQATTDEQATADELETTEEQTVTENLGAEETDYAVYPEELELEADPIVVSENDVEEEIVEELGVIASGTGWSLADNGTLTVSTDAAMEAMGWKDYKSQIVTVDIQFGVTYIRSVAFASCSSLKRANIPATVTQINGNGWNDGGAFYNDIALETVTFESGSQLVTIGKCAFNGCTRLASITFPSGLATIEKMAFNECHSMENVILPNTVTSIGDTAFSKCSAMSELDLGHGLSSLGVDVFYGCTALRKVTIPATLTDIPTNTFSGCTSLEEVTIEEGVKTIGPKSFKNCTSLKKVSIPASLTQIKGDGWNDGGAFLGDTALETVIFAEGSQLKLIGQSSFSGCTALEQFVFPTGLTTIEKMAFSECNSLEKVTLPDTVTTIYEAAFSKCSAMSELDLGHGLSSLGVDVFYGCTALRKVTIPATLTDIPTNTFSGCTSLEEVTIEEGVKSIGPKSFKNCTSLKKISIPASLTQIKGDGWNDGGAFIGDKSLKTVEIAEGSKLTTIGAATFSGCERLTTFNIPDRVTTIEDYAFYGCNALQTITGGDSVTVVGKQAFDSKGYEDGTNLQTIVTTGSNKIKDYDWASAKREVVTTITKYVNTDKDEDKNGEGSLENPNNKTEFIDSAKDTTNGNLNVVLNKQSFTYTGYQILPSIKVKYTYIQANNKKKTITLKENVDYTLTYGNNVNAGAAIVSVNGIGNFDGLVERTYSITKKSISKVKIFAPEQVEYTDTLWKDLKSEIIVFDGNIQLDPSQFDLTGIPNGKITSDTDISLFLSASNKADSNYVGSVTKPIKIKVLANASGKSSAKDITVALKPNVSGQFEYTGKAIKPKVVVTYGGVTLSSKNYKLIYKNNIHTGTASVYAVGKGSFYGMSKPLEYKIVARDINKVKVNKVGTRVYGTSDNGIKLTVKYNGKALKEGKDFTVEHVSKSYQNFILGLSTIVTTYKIKAVPGSDFTGEKTVTFKIGRISLSNIFTTKVTGDNYCKMSNNSGKLKVNVYYKGTKLTEGTDYTLTYKNIKVGKKATLIIKGTGNFSGSRTVKYLVK